MLRRSQLGGPMAPHTELTDLLRKCHREELVPLAMSLRIKPEGMRLGTLARAIDARLRRYAANDIENILRRGGDGPTYPSLLRRAGRRVGIDVPKDPALAEHAIALEQTRRSWNLLPDRSRGEPGPDQDQSLYLLERKHRRGWSYHVLQMMNEPPAPMPGCLFVTWMTRPRFDIVMPAILEIGRLRQAVRHRVTIGVVGSPSSGKDAAVEALFGIQTGNVNPVAGSTKRVEITRLPGHTALFVVNTPGLGDVVEDVTEEARQVMDHIDVYLYIINAQGGVQAREKADYESCLASGRPVLAVVNKIDTLREQDRERYLIDARQKLESPEEDFLAAAFDPLPQLASRPIGIAMVRKWVSDHLTELGKDPTELPWYRHATVMA